PSAGPAQPPTPAASKEPAEDPEKKAFSLADLIEQVEPSVVRINTKDSRGGGTGSGFVVDKDGTVVTNHHVIAGAASATVEFADGFKTPVLGYTNLVTTKDIAILKIKCDPSKLHPLPLAEKLPRKGESVVACGAPYGLSFSFSEGIVSAIRGKKELATFQIKHEGTWIQTTTPISSGNSGGPLINMKGEVVAANTLVLTIGQNLNFSVSSMDISEAIAKQKTPIAKLIPAKTRIAGSRRRPGNVDETKSERGRRLLGQIDELSLVMLAFNSDPIAGVDAADHVHSIIEKNITKLGGIPLKSNADTAMYVFMELDRAGTGSRKELILGSYVLVRDKNEDGPMQVVKVWEGRERLGNYSPAQVRKTHRLPSSVVKRVLEYLKKFREQHEAAAKELKEEGDSKSE
ncbi:MAG: hypothetical protein CMJ48_07375, partial [Planctomycetaceae bacterium]|nr:hypothetical protein [Planctomycetaceae bacterium]